MIKGGWPYPRDSSCRANGASYCGGVSCRAKRDMVLYCDKRFPQVCFGVSRLRAALEYQHIHCLERNLFDYTGCEGEAPILTVSFRAQPFGEKAAEEIGPQGFEIRVAGKTVHILGADIAGAMYGLLEAAEDIRLGGWEALVPKARTPTLGKRGIKFNLPFEPYDIGDPFTKNTATCLDRHFWESYIDFLAENRYNVLSLWSEHPYHMMFRLEKYPEACPYSEEELAGYRSLYRFIFARCKERCIETYLITWNIRITPFVAKALGLPEELGDMEPQYDVVYDHCNHIPNISRQQYGVRQHLPVIKDYMKECIRTLLLTYEDLGGLGTNCAEEMVGDAVTRQQWVMEAYLAGIEESGRDIPFIMRTNMGNGKVATAFLDEHNGTEKYISWKYSNAHMYSSTRPQFEKLWKAWDGVDMSKVKVLYTVRNDDVNTLRWADMDYLREYIAGMDREYVEGYYWGADGYLWGADFQISPHITRSWKYDYEKHWTQFWLLGRLGYYLNEPAERFRAQFDIHYGPWGGAFHDLLQAASRIIPAVNRLMWLDYDFQWHPESLLSAYGFKTVLDFVESKAMPDVGTLSIADYALSVETGKDVSGFETPADVLEILAGAAASLEEGLGSLEAAIPAPCRCDEVESTILDLVCWRHLASYYHCKISAALALCCFRGTGEQACKEEAIHLLEDALEHYRALSLAWSRQYLPYRMARTKYLFGYPLYLQDVERDISMARSFSQRPGF